MPKLIGAVAVVDPTSVFSKRAALLFDGVIAGLDMWSGENVFGQLQPSEILEGGYESTTEQSQSPLIAVINNFYGESKYDVMAAWFDFVADGDTPASREKCQEMDAYSLKLFESVSKNTNNNLNFVPWLFSSQSIEPNPTSREQVARLIFNNLPLPSADTPWGAIHDWRRDEEARAKYRRLRAWMNRVCREGLSTYEVEDELATLIDDYKQYMALQHSKMNRSRVEVLAVTTAEILESIATLKLSKAVERLCGLFRSEVSLKEIDLSAPGREVAYISASHERFAK